MCGIVGRITWNQPAEPSRVMEMATLLRHRGPDDQGLFVEGPVALGHCRLSVLDPRALASQPMSDGSGRYVIVFNGEIYNFRALRSELEELGQAFRTSGDTEVLVEGFAIWGDALFPKLNGMFALAIWDRQERRLVLARDRLGKKPLFWMFLPEGGLAFASEIKALCLEPSLSHRISPSALGQYLTLGYVLTSAAILDGVEKIPPAHVFRFDPDRPPRRTRYWDLAGYFAAKKPLRYLGEAAEELRDLLDDAVRLRLVSDVPFGAFLSGGLDSAAITSSMCRAVGPRNVRTFTMGFAQRAFDERPEAEMAAAYFGCNHVGGEARPDSLGQLGTIAWHADEPLADTSLIPMFQLAQFARQHVTVALSGDGGDELFAGYETYVADQIHPWVRRLPPLLLRVGQILAAHLPASHGKVPMDYKIRQFLAGCSLEPDEAHFSWRRLFTPEEIRRLLLPERFAMVDVDSAKAEFRALAGHLTGAHDLDRAMYVDIKSWLVDDILVKVDRASMAHGLEVRAPLLDYRLVEFAAALPVSVRMPGLAKKRVLKASQEGLVPSQVLKRRKAGFNAPINLWLSSVSPEVLVRELSGDWFDPVEVGRLVAEHKARMADHGFRLFALKMWQEWLGSVGISAGVSP